MGTEARAIEGKPLRRLTGKSKPELMVAWARVVAVEVESSGWDPDIAFHSLQLLNEC